MHYPLTERLKRVPLAHTPTPLEPLPSLAEHLGGPAIYIKRDDGTGLAFGGNKTRKLEFLMADALAQGADTVIAVGGVQSNHVRQTVAAAAKLGLKAEAVLCDIVEGRDGRRPRRDTVRGRGRPARRIGLADGPNTGYRSSSVRTGHYAPPGPGSRHCTAGRDSLRPRAAGADVSRYRTRLP